MIDEIAIIGNEEEIRKRIQEDVTAVCIPTLLRACACERTPSVLLQRLQLRRFSLVKPSADRIDEMKALYVLRHGQTEWNVQRRMQGRLNSLTAEGKPKQLAMERCSSAWEASISCGSQAQARPDKRQNS